MTRKIIAIILLIVMMFLLCGCSSSGHPLATETNNTKAFIRMDEKTIVVDVEAYTNGSNGIITIYGTDGKIYRTHFVNVALVKDAEGR